MNTAIVLIQKSTLLGSARIIRLLEKFLNRPFLLTWPFIGSEAGGDLVLIQNLTAFHM